MPKEERLQPIRRSNPGTPACHGPDGTASTTMGKSLGIKSYKSPDVQKQSDADLKNTIVNGKGKMPSYRTLTPEQVDGLVKYIRELGK